MKDAELELNLAPPAFVAERQNRSRTRGCRVAQTPVAIQPIVVHRQPLPISPETSDMSTNINHLSLSWAVNVAFISWENTDEAIRVRCGYETQLLAIKSARTLYL